MAYVSQEKKAKIAAALKSVMPKGWKYSLAVDRHSAIVLTISAAPVDLIAANLRPAERKAGHIDVNHFHLDGEFAGELLTTFEAIRVALNIDNYDNSDSMTDYFDVGHYVDIRIGRWNKPFRHLAPATEAVAA